MGFYRLSARLDRHSLENLGRIAKALGRNRSVALRFILRRSPARAFDLPKPKD